MPKFNYKGFQFVEVSSSAPIQLSDENLIAVEMHSDVPAIGYWSSSSDLLNKIWKATNSSYLANLFGYPTDCPQREKNGWTGDAHIAIETGLYNFDGISIYEKWMNDFCDEQKTTESSHVSSQLLYGAMIGPTGSTGRVLSPLSLGKFIDFTEIPHYSAACTDQSKNMSPI